MTSLIGQTINDRYRLDALLGDGGMGTVYRAFDRNLDRQVAIKLMHSHFARQPEFRKRLIQEAQTAAKLDHPSIVRIYDFGESDLGLFITMEYVDGGSLREHLQRLQTMGKFLPFSQSMQIGIQIAEALDYAHRRGVIHRDVKPGNIILKRLSHPDEPGEQPFRAVLTDFGLVKLQEGIPMTQSGATVGTPAYMSPEQCEGMELDGRSDLYSLGVVLYELVTNRLPFTFQSLADAISTHRRGTRPAPPSEYRNDAPPLIDGLLAKALAKSPDDRFSNGFEMATALRSAKLSLEGTPTRIMTRQELNILDRVENPPEGYELEISAPGHQPSVMSLIHSIITLGRNADNDVVLPADGVSRHHARLQATSLGWEVLDLGGPNGTWLDDRRLRPQEPTPLLPGAKLRVGPYELELLAPDVSASALTADLAAAAAAAGLAAATVPGATTRGLPENGSASALAVYPIQDTIEVDPGKEAEIKLEVINRSELADRVSLRVQGVPPSWITTPTAFVPIQAGETVEMSVGILAPLNQSTPTGRQRVLIGLVSQRHPEADASASLNLVVNPVFTFAATMEPQQMRLPGTATISVQNTGSAAGEFSVIARDPQDALEFTGEKGRISIQPGQVAHVNLEVKARESSFFDSDDVYPYEVNVVSRTGGRQQLSAEAIAGGLIPPWLLYALILLTTICCAALAFAAFLNRDRLFPPSATATLPFAGIGATQTAAAMTQTAVAAAGGTQTPTIDATSTIQTATAQAGLELTATRAAATTDAQGDSDGDGLSNAQERFIGTDPFNPDTDGDGLSDGQEVLDQGTDPLRVDTDGDTFSDGNEVLFIGSNPLNPNDPVPMQPTMGPPPIRTRPPWVTQTRPPIPTRTMPPIPTRTMPPVPTFTMPPPPTATQPPTITWTPPPTATPSITPTPTNTATPTLTPTATDIPIGPVPSISCAASPPNINGSFDPGEWPASPIAQFSAAANPGFSVQAYLSRDSSNYYVAYLINDPAVDANDTVRTGFDNDASGYGSSGGYDPDVSDRFFIVNRDGSGEVWAGIGSNTDSLSWDSSYSSSNWNYAVGESAAQWVVEMQIAASELNLQALFGMMSQAQSGTSIATWPGVAFSNDPSTWQPINNANCP